MCGSIEKHGSAQMNNITRFKTVFPYKVFVWLILALMTSLVLLACNGSDTTATVKPTFTPGPTPTARVVEVEKSPGSLTVYMGRGETLISPIIEQFESLTGINVAVKYASTTQLAATLQEEGDRSPADVFFAQDPGGLGAVENMFVRLPDSILSRVPEWARSREGKWVGLSGRARTIVYNSNELTEADLPRTAADAFAALASAVPAFSGLTYDDIGTRGALVNEPVQLSGD